MNRPYFNGYFVVIINEKFDIPFCVIIIYGIYIGLDTFKIM